MTASTIGLLAGVQFLAYAGLQIPIGILSDRFGPNFDCPALLNELGTLIYSVAPNYSVLFIARLLAGIGDATIWVNLVLILSQWFKVKEFIGLLWFCRCIRQSLVSLMAAVTIYRFDFSIRLETSHF